MRWFIIVKNGDKAVEYASFASRDHARSFAAAKKEQGLTASVVDRRATPT